MSKEFVTVIGAGLAGSEAAWQIAKMGVDVHLYEMKPVKYSPCHHMDTFAELVCSNSFRSNQLSNAVGLLKYELHNLGSLIMEAAYASEVPAGSALAVDRIKFSQYITEKIKACPNITIHNEEVTEIPKDGITVVASGPLTSDSLAEKISEMLGNQELHFYDAVAPIVDASTIDMEKAFFASRYDKGTPTDYLNCPFTKEEYDLFYQELRNADVIDLKDVDKEKGPNVFEGCLPIEVIASRGYDTLRFGPMKPVGLVNPKTNKEAYATVQLRKENVEGSMYNIVGFQTHLTFGEQKRVFRLIPGLENAEFLRYGVMHRNTYIQSPKLLNNDYSMRENPNIFFAGQMTGVEGYIESTGSGFVAGINAARQALGKERYIFHPCTMLGAMAQYVSTGTLSGNFQPMNANFGIIEPLNFKVKGGKSARNEEISKRSIALLDSIKEDMVH